METIIEAATRAQQNLQKNNQTQHSQNIMPQITGKSEFLKKYSPVNNYGVGKTFKEIVQDGSPCLSDFCKKYGKDTVIDLIMLHVRDLFVFAGLKKLINPTVVANIAAVIVSGYAHLNIAELLHFFRLFKAGYFGKFYNAVDGLTITTALQAFENQRKSVILQAESDRREAESQRRRAQYLEWQQRAVSHDKMQALIDAHRQAGDFDEWVESLQKEYEERNSNI